MQEDLKIVIRGDIVQVTKSLDELQKEFSDLEKQLKTKTGAAFIETNKELDRLRETMTKVKNIGRTGFNEFGDALTTGSKGIKAAGRAADQAAPAIFSLSQVARDLPFGFIAIQNNLPQVADSFSALAKNSGGLKATFSLLAQSLIGPAGIGLAFGALISIVTVAIQKYGSLGAAIDALIKGGDKYYQQQLLLQGLSKEANKNAGTEIARYGFLTQTINNSALSLQVRKDAIKDLKAEYGAYLGNLTDEDLLNGKLALSTAEVTKALQNKALAQAAVAKAGELSSKVLEDLEKEDKLTADIIRKTNEAERLRGKARVSTSSTGAASISDPAQEALRVVKALQKERDAIRESRKETEKQIELLFNRAQANTKAAGDGAISIESLTKKQQEADAIKAQADRDALERLKKLQAAEKSRLENNLSKIEAELKTVGVLTQRYEDLAKAKARTQAALALVGEDQEKTKAKIRRELERALSSIADEFNQGRINAGKIDFTSILDFDPAEGAKKFAALVRPVIVDGFAQAKALAPKSLNGKVEIIPAGEAAENIKALAKMNEQVLALSGNFSSTLAPAIDAAFAALQSGQNIVQGIGEVFKRLVIQIGATIIKAAILAAILQSAGLGGAFGATKGVAGGFGKIFSGLLGIGSKGVPSGGFSGGGSGQISTPSFSGFGGGLNITVTGELRGRGTELVGVFNQANQRIGRTG